MNFLFVLFCLAFLKNSKAQDSSSLKNTDINNTIHELNKFIELKLWEENVLGLSVTLINNHEVVWEKAYGKANNFTGEEVTTGSAFEVASNGKAIFSYAVLILDKQNEFKLDDQLNKLVKESFITRGKFQDNITAKHVLTHTSGLTNHLRERERVIGFEPGKGYSYSGVGFMYLQEAIEALTGQTLDEFAKERVFKPIGMENSYYSKAEKKELSFAKGHILFGDALSPISSFFIPGCFLLLGAFVIYRRYRSKEWQLVKEDVLKSIGISLIVAFLLIATLLGFMRLAMFFFIC
ncbi:MAG: serine hydrolase, partial [Bacteroidetes bacterium]|nr:serine hydrolase [Bacteroidota bacterium]